MLPLGKGVVEKALAMPKGEGGGGTISFGIVCTW